MDSVLKCKCGGEIFVEFTPAKYTVEGFKVWTSKMRIEKECTTIPVVMCVTCGRFSVPVAGFPGKNVLDPEVKMYAELIENVKVYNATLEGCGCNPKEGMNVETTGRSRKTSKSTL